MNMNNTEIALTPIWNYLTDFMGEVFEVSREEFIGFCVEQANRLANEPNNHGQLFEDVVVNVIHKFNLGEFCGDDSPEHVGFISGMIMGCLMSAAHFINPDPKQYTIV